MKNTNDTIGNRTHDGHSTVPLTFVIHDVSTTLSNFFQMTTRHLNERSFITLYGKR